MLCRHCGYWNDAVNRRCNRCGRRIEEKPRALQARLGFEREAPSASRAVKKGAALPPPAPEWKQELEQKLESYRVRRRSSDESPKTPAAKGRAAAEPSAALEQNVIDFGGRPAGAGLKAAAASAPNTGSLPAGWRKVERSKPAPKLPPLRKPGAEFSAAPASAAAVSDEPPQAALGQPAPVGPRLLAGSLDFTMMGAALGIFAAVFHWMGALLHSADMASLLPWLISEVEGVRAIAFVVFTITVFYWIFYIRYIGETPGMTWLGLRVISLDGRGPTTAQRWTRALGMVLSTAAAGVGFMWCIADEEQMTWHDRLSKTYLTRDETELQSQASNPVAAPQPHLKTADPF